MTAVQASERTVATEDWLLLVILSLLWGGSFIFIGIAVKELPPLLIVAARVILATVVLLPVHLFMLGKLPHDSRSWTSFAVMSVTNNIIPFMAIVYGQQFISAGLASVINATTPLFGAAFMAMAGAELLSSRKIFALLAGLAGVVVLRGVAWADFGGETIGILSCLAASASYGLGSLWAKKRLTKIPPLTTATGQLLCSSAVLLILVSMFGSPKLYLAASWPAWFSMAGLALLSTSIAYLLFFKIITRSGPTAANLVTMLIPVSAIAMGAFLLHESVSLQEAIGIAIIALALLLFDGRILQLLPKPRQSSSRLGQDPATHRLRHPGGSGEGER